MTSIYTLSGESLAGITVDDSVPLEQSNCAYHLRGSGNSLIDCTTIDSRCRVSAHCDHVQLIPQGAEPNAQFFGATAYDNIIDGGGLASNGSMQGIFNGDGAQANLTVTNQIINTESAHKISLYGLLSGAFFNNKDALGVPVATTLDNLRIGGGHPQSFYVTSFRKHRYEAVLSDQHIHDLRGQKHNPLQRYVDDFDLDLFRRISAATPYPHDGFNQHFERTLGGYDVCNPVNHILILDRFWSDTQTTISRLSLNGEFLCHILEDAFRDEKIHSRTRIPAGAYKVGLRAEGGFHQRYAKRFSEFHRGMLELKGVPHFNYILFHVGNHHDDTAGCLLTGRWVQKSNTVRESALTYQRVYTRLRPLVGDLAIIVEDNDR